MPAAFANTFTVNTAADSGPGSLRDAITAANAAPDTDTIQFDLPLGGSTIAPQTNLPDITAPVIIDGTIPGAINGAQQVRLDGGLAGGNGIGLEFAAFAGASTVRGLTVTGFQQYGINTGTDTVTVAGNFVGTDSAGSSGLGNSIGVLASGPATIGGTTAADRNVISGNQDGIYLNGSNAIVEGDYIGTNPAGTAAVPNALRGIFLNPGTSETIGGAEPGAGNVISGNSGTGIDFDPGTGSSIVGNLIGTQVDGVSPLGNGNAGITITQNGPDNNTIGGTGAGDGNTIAYNQFAGISISGSGRGDLIEGNDIFSNTGLGIDLAPTGVTPNDANDSDIGPNELQNWPVLATATPLPGGGVEVTGSITPPPSTYAVDLYANSSCDPSGNGEGARYLGTFHPSLAGQSSFDTASIITAPVNAGEWITATVTDVTGLNDTSEFSNCVQVPGTLEYTVTNANNAGAGSLRQAIQSADAGGAPAVINFAITGGGPQTIAVSSALPPITVPVTIDGSTEGGAPAGTVDVFIDGGGLAGADGLHLSAGSDGSVIRGLGLGGFGSGGSALHIQSNGNTIAGDYIGTDPTGTDQHSNVLGMLIEGANNMIGGNTAADRNLISGNNPGGIEVTGSGATDNAITGNYLGVDVSGATALENGTPIDVESGADNTTIGGTTPGSGNVISGNFQSAVVIDAAGAVVQGNLIGPDATDSTVLGNDIGVELDGGATGATVGGPGAAANVIAGSDDVGVLVNSGTFNSITGNFLGTELDGTPFTTVANDEGVRILHGTGNTFTSNRISSSTEQGVEADDGPNTFSGNTIDHNGGAGITVTGATGVLMSRNSIDLNNGLGIDLGNNGVTPNDAQPDNDTGPNNLQNFPTGLAGTIAGSTVHVTGTLPSGQSTFYTVEFFASPAKDPSGNGEGAQYLGSSRVDTDGNGAGVIDAVLTPSVVPAAGQWLSATATAPDGSTSEFAPSVQLQSIPGTTVTVAPEADTMVDAHQAGTNFNGLDYSDVYGGSTSNCVLADGTSYTLMRFDLSGIPAGATIVNAVLQTTTRAGFAQDGDPDHWALFIPNDSWDPSTVNWNNRPADGTLFAGSSQASGGGDIRGSNLAMGAADVFRAGCNSDPDGAGPQAKDFPSSNVDGFQSIAQTEANLVSHITTQRSGDGKLSLELWTPACQPSDACPQGAGSAYWARYYTIRASDPTVRPRLVVTYQGSAVTGSVTLSAGAPDAQAGAAQVKLKDVPPSAIVGSALGVSSAPLGSIPLGSIPVGSIPLGSIPVGSIPVGSIGLNASQTLLSSVSISTIPLVPPSSWSAILAGTPLASVPIQNVTLGQVLANTTASGRLSSVPLGSIDLTRSPLGSIPLGSIPLGSIPLGSIPVPPASGEPSTDSTLQRWCTWLQAPPITCTSPTQLSGTTLMGVALQGAPLGSIPLGSIPVGSIPLGSIPLGSIPLGSIPVGSITIDRVAIQFSPVGSIPLGSIPLGSIPVGSIPLGSIPVGSIDLQNSPVGSIPVGSIGSALCLGACPTTGLLKDHLASLLPGLTLEQLMRGTAAGTFDHITFADVIAFTSPATLHGFTIAQLVASLPPNNNVTYADVLALLMDPGALDWETLNLQATKVQNLSTNGSTVGYEADFHLDPNGGPSGVPHATTLNVTIPSGFLYQPGSTQLLIGNVPVASQPGDPTIGNDGTLSWALSPLTNTDYRITFTTRPGLTLGPTAAKAELVPSGSPASPTETPASVGIDDTFEPNNSPATAQPISADSFYLSYLTSKTDVDYYTFPIPPAGTRTTFHLSHLPADYDLVVYGPAGAQQLRPPVASTPPIDGQPLADSGFATTHATDPLPPQTLNDVALVSNLPVYGVSTLRGTQDDAVAVISNGESGVYTVQVSGFDGASSDQPYMLRAETTPPPVAANCTPRTFTGSGTVAPSLVTVASGQTANLVNTLFVVDDQQIGKVYGSAGTGVVTKLNSAATLTGFTNAGFPAAIVHVDNNLAVQNAYTAWNACPSDPGKADDTVKAIASVIDSVRSTYRNVEYLVLVGGDDVIPFARIDDLTTVSTENGYAENFPATTALGGSLAAAKLLTDDPYGTTAPVPFLNRQLYVPDLVTGRLVETPANINAQIDAFLGGTTPGHLHPSTALTTGYDFLSDGATAVSGALGTVATGGGANKTAISDTWTRSTLIGPPPGGLLLPSNGSPPPDIVSLNAHADHNRFEPASGTALLSASDVAAATQTFGGRLVLTMGCHAGLSVFDAFIAQNNLDWAQLFAQKGAAAYVANTGFGYGDSSTIAYSEDLNRLFATDAVGGAANTNGATYTLGEALTLAKQTYKGDLGIVGVYDEKAMAELTFYGLPMYRIGGSGPVSPPSGTSNPPVTSFPTDSATGLHVESFAANASFDANSPTSTGRGSFFTGNDGVELEHFRPIEPKVIRTLTIPQAHGALLTELTSQDIQNFNPVYARPTVDSSGAEPEVSFDDAAFPSKLQAVTTFKQLQSTDQQVVLAQGQFFTTNPSDGSGAGTERLFTHEAGQVFSSASTDFAPPVFSTLEAQVVNGSALFTVDATDTDGAAAGTVKRVVVAYLETGGSVWHFIDLVQAAPGSSRWSGSAPLTGTHLQYFVQAVDANGNVAVSTNKGLYFNEVPPPPPPSGGVTVATTTGAPASGWFDGAADVQVTVNGQAPGQGTTTLSIDGGTPQPYTAPVHVTGDGFHTATAQTADGTDTTSFFVDSGPPTITLTTPGVNAAIAQGSSTTPVFGCSDAGIGVQSCASSGAAFTTAQLGFHTFTVTAADKLGKTSTASVTYDVIRITTPPAAASYPRSTSVNADFGCGPGTCTAQVTKPGGTVATIANGDPLPTDTSGGYSLAVTNTNGANSATLVRGYTVGAPANVTGKILFMRLGNIWAINSNGTGGTKLTTGLLPIDTQPAKSPDGSKIVFSRLSAALGGRQLWVMDADGENQVQLTSSGDNTAPEWSPDGTKIAFQSTRAGSKGIDVWVGTWNPALPNPLTNLADLTNTAGDDVTPSWSPASTGRIAFASNRKQNQFDIYTMKTDGTNQTQITTDSGTDFTPDWSPDGTKIAFASNRGSNPSGFDIYVMTASSGASQTRLTKLSGEDVEPYWLDNTHIVFSSVNLFGLGVIAPTGGTPSRVPNTILGDLDAG